MKRTALPPIRTLGILRGYNAGDALALAERCWDAGIDLVEVPVQTDAAWAALAAVVERADGRPVGAGTVIDEKRARRAIDVGAEILVMPGFDERVVDVGREAGAVVLPGAMTPTEVQRCLASGVDTCKLFPIGVLGVDHLRALRPVFPEIGFVATGGVGPHNAEELVASGARALAFGGAIEQVLDNPAALATAAAIANPWLPRPPR